MKLAALTGALSAILFAASAVEARTYTFNYKGKDFERCEKTDTCPDIKDLPIIGTNGLEGWRGSISIDVTGLPIPSLKNTTFEFGRQFYFFDPNRDGTSNPVILYSFVGPKAATSAIWEFDPEIDVLNEVTRAPFLDWDGVFDLYFQDFFDNEYGRGTQAVSRVRMEFDAAGRVETWRFSSQNSGAWNPIIGMQGDSYWNGVYLTDGPGEWVSIVPLPAGALFLLTGLGALGIARAVKARKIA